jgi:protein involved in polysaccharide export with SLBB domain
MNRSPYARASIALALLALAGCASTTPLPTAGAPAGTPIAAPEPARLPPSVDENDTFVMVDGRPAYKLGPGDALEVVLTKELAQDRVTADVTLAGRVTIDVSEIAVAGLTAEQAAAAIRQALAPTHRVVGVTVTVKEHRSKVVSVIGEVQNTAQIPLRGRTTLLDLLVTAGGLRPQADLHQVRLLRRDGQSYTLDLLHLVGDGERIRDLVLDAGDVVFVPGKRSDESRVFLLGEVVSPGAFTITPGMRLSHALALAGGPKDTALLDNARVLRANQQQQLQVIQVDFERALSGLDGAQDIALASNDIIVVPRTRIGNWNAFLARIRPTIEFASLPLTAFSQYLLIKELLR